MPSAPDTAAAAPDRATPAAAAAHRLAIRPAVISAPFGNYIQPAGTTPTLGTFTRHARGGRVWRILKTVRYYPRLGAWVNRIGLRNPGIDWLTDRAGKGSKPIAGRLVSVHGFDPQQWRELIEACAAMREPDGKTMLAVELNMSCPNVGEVEGGVSAWRELFDLAIDRLGAEGIGVVVKLPPVRYEAMAESAWDAGVRGFHCCNTLPVPGGGMSGAPLMPLSLRCIAWMRERFGEEAQLIGGGGINQPEQVDTYRHAGADHIALGTVCMDPRLLFSDKKVRATIERARGGA
jgi:dihydroorotate dehydrogenase